MATSRSDLNRSQRDAPSEKSIWEALDSLQAQLTALQKPTASRLSLLREIPLGGIIMWSGKLNTIPENYALCDGTNGTPDLRAKFVVGVATSSTDPGATGGAATHVHDIADAGGTIAITGASAGTPAGTNAAATDHSHTFTQSANAATPDLLAADVTPTGVAASGTTDAAGAHNHVFTGTPLADHTHLITGLTAEKNHLPPYYAVAFLMRIT